jgi:hypothetical protein
MAGDGYGYARTVSASYDLSHMALWPRLWLEGDYRRATILLSPVHAPGDTDPPQQVTLQLTLRRADLFSLVHQGSVVMRRVMGLSFEDYGEGLEEEARQRRLETAARFPVRPAAARAKTRKRGADAEVTPVSEARARIAAIARRNVVRDESDGRRYIESRDIDAAT